MSSAALRISAGWPLVAGGSRAGRPPSGQYHSIAERGLPGSTMSLGTSISTGPGRPVVAMWNASRTTRGMSWASVTR